MFKLFVLNNIRTSLLLDSRSFTKQAQPTKESLMKAYIDAKAYCDSKKLPADVSPSGVFACNRLNLNDIKVHGYDYDYTLACYRTTVEKLIYDLAKDALLTKFKYPSEIDDLRYNPNFAVRGLHYDIEKGLLLKIDSFTQIQMGSVYRGLTPLKEEEVIKLYGHRKIPVSFIENSDKTANSKMVQLNDLFSLPEMNLLCNVAEYFYRARIDFNPEILFRDVKECVQSIHPVMHGIVSRAPSEYLHFDPLLKTHLQNLRNRGKKTFLLTNSPFHFVNCGLKFLIGEDWQDLFDVVITEARKPSFFSAASPFRIIEDNVRLWDRVYKLEKGIVYADGNLKDFQNMTGWLNDSVIYFGDHAYTDLADVTLHHGWRTGAIIKELSWEIEKLNSEDFKRNMNWLQFLTSLLETYQAEEDPDIQDIIKTWQQERYQIRKKTKIIFNAQFGSCFRTHLNPTFFSKRLFRFADIYTSSITNLMRYSPRHTFYPRRGALPHEYRSWFN